MNNNIDQKKVDVLRKLIAQKRMIEPEEVKILREKSEKILKINFIIFLFFCLVTFILFKISLNDKVCLTFLGLSIFQLYLMILCSDATNKEIDKSLNTIEILISYL